MQRNKKNLQYIELEPVNFGNAIFDDDGKFDLNCVIDCLKKTDYVSWDDKTGETDNKKPFKVLINGKYLIKFQVVRGECIEATWDHRIWSAEVYKIKLVTTYKHVPDVEKRPKPEVVEPAPIVLADDEIMFLGKPTKVIKKFNNPFKLIGIKPYWLEDTAHATVEPFEDVELENGSIVYGVMELQNVLIFKLKPEDTDYYLSPTKNKYKEITE